MPAHRWTWSGEFCGTQPVSKENSIGSASLCEKDSGAISQVCGSLLHGTARESYALGDPWHGRLSNGEQYLVDCVVGAQDLVYRADRDVGGAGNGKAVGAAANRGEGERLKSVGDGQLERLAVAGSEQLIFPV